MDDGPKVVTQNDMFGAVLEVTGWKVPAVPRGRVGKLASDLLATGIFPHDVVLRFGRTDPGNGWWYWRDDWRGRKGQMPNEAALREGVCLFDLATAVQLPARQTSKYADALSFLEKLEAAEHGN